MCGSCAGRRDDAIAAVETARALQAAAEAEIAAADLDVLELERQLALHTTTPPLSSAPHASPMDPVQILLAGLIENLSDDPYVPASQVLHATQHVTKLIEGFHSVANEALMTRHASNAATRGAPTHRVDGKQPQPPPPSCGSMVRHTGKQVPKRLFTDHFKDSRKVAKCEPLPRRGNADFGSMSD